VRVGSAIAVVVGAGALLLAGSLRAAEDPAPTAEPKRDWELAPLPLVYYTPETSLGFALQALLLRTKSTGSLEHERHDSVAIGVTGTLRRQFGVSLAGFKYWDEDRHRLGLELTASRFPSKFWGIGADTPADAVRDYVPVLYGGRGSLSTRVFEQVFIGVLSAVGHYHVDSFEAEGAVADYLATRPHGGWMVGVGPAISRDSRDDSAFPRNGSYTTLGATFFHRAIGSTYTFTSYELDHRTFVSLPLDSVLALQAYLQIAPGEPPIDFVPAIGGPSRLRGYIQGRYRDQGVFMTQAEWRVRLFWRIGAVVFAGVGEAFGPDARPAVTRLLPAGGGGLRLDVGKEKPANLRVDVGVGRSTFGVYLTVGEAF